MMMATYLSTTQSFAVKLRTSRDYTGAMASTSGSAGGGESVSVVFELFQWLRQPEEQREGGEESSGGIMVCLGRDLQDEEQMNQRQYLLMASLSHELRTPLNAILANLELFETVTCRDTHRFKQIGSGAGSMTAEEREGLFVHRALQAR